MIDIICVNGGFWSLSVLFADIENLLSDRPQHCRVQICFGVISTVGIVRLYHKLKPRRKMAARKVPFPSAQLLAIMRIERKLIVTVSCVPVHSSVSPATSKIRQKHLAPENRTRI